MHLTQIFNFFWFYNMTVFSQCFPSLFESPGLSSALDFFNQCMDWCIPGRQAWALERPSLCCSQPKKKQKKNRPSLMFEGIGVFSFIETHCLWR